MLQVEQPCDQTRRRRRPALVRREEPGPFPLEELPVDQRGEFHQLVAHVDHVDEPRARQIVCSNRRGFAFIAPLEIAWFLPASY